MATNLLMQWKEPGPARPMTDDGRKPRSERCEPADGVLYLAGTGITDAGGSWSLDVRDALCPDQELGMVQTVSIVATPNFDPFIKMLDPCHATAGWSVSGSTLTLYVRTWDCRCELKPDTAFSYHAAIAYVFVT
ncbi:hypothetical protein [Longimicrobium sp.]|uniref:hypothetical protein n=1 Tax=Longimicrobium sp. TaxID=2029185 RepID=UPI002E301843|nr:hypothetical protein [Longimicrobium sp.]HEX6038403.1 hypothetical protein [Longimicrobium sp.]